MESIPVILMFDAHTKSQSKVIFACQEVKFPLSFAKNVPGEQDFIVAFLRVFS